MYPCGSILKIDTPIAGKMSHPNLMLNNGQLPSDLAECAFFKREKASTKYRLIITENKNFNRTASQFLVFFSLSWFNIGKR
jgi:hypothetical protein